MPSSSVVRKWELCYLGLHACGMGAPGKDPHIRVGSLFPSSQHGLRRLLSHALLTDRKRSKCLTEEGHLGLKSVSPISKRKIFYIYIVGCIIPVNRGH